MSQTMTIYVGLKKVGKMREAALKKEAKRQGDDVSVSDVIWGLLKMYGSSELKADLEAAEKERA